jgi:hypothetical protein
LKNSRIISGCATLKNPLKKILSWNYVRRVNMKLCRDCSNRRIKRRHIITNDYYCKLAGFGVLPYATKPHPKCPLNNKQGAK